MLSGERVLALLTESRLPKAISIEQIQHETNLDNELKKVMEALVSNNWDSVSPIYKALRHQLCTVNRLVLKGERIVVPENLEKHVLELAHMGHPGQNRMKMRLRSKVWMPNLEYKVERYVRSCKGCVMVSVPNCPPPMRCKQFPDGPFEELAIDYKEIGSVNLLVIVDLYSKYCIWELVQPATARESGIALERVFGQFGVPTVIHCDNGKHFEGELIKLCERYGIRFFRSPPRYPQVNGQVERVNRNVKEKVQTAIFEGKDWRVELSQFLLAYHATRHPSLGNRTPSEALFQRNIRDILPTLERSLHPDDEPMRDANSLYKHKSQEYTNRKLNARPSDIKMGDVVLARNFSKSGLVPNFGPEEFEVTNVQNHEILAKSRDTPNKTIKRHPTHLKVLTRKEPELHNDEQENQGGEGEDGETDNEEPKNRLPSRRRQLPKRLEDCVLYWTAQGTEEGDDW